MPVAPLPEPRPPEQLQTLPGIPCLRTKPGCHMGAQPGSAGWLGGGLGGSLAALPPLPHRSRDSQTQVRAGVCHSNCKEHLARPQLPSPVTQVPACTERRSVFCWERNPRGHVGFNASVNPGARWRLQRPLCPHPSPHAKEWLMQEAPGLPVPAGSGEHERRSRGSGAPCSVAGGSSCLRVASSWRQRGLAGALPRGNRAEMRPMPWAQAEGKRAHAASISPGGACQEGWRPQEGQKRHLQSSAGLSKGNPARELPGGSEVPATRALSSLSPPPGGGGSSSCALHRRVSRQPHK